MRKNQALSIIILAALLLIILALYTARTPIYNVLNNLKLIPQPERFTELYFDDASNLPRASVAGEPLSFAFTINNIEGTSTVYPYAIYFQDLDGAKIPLQKGVVTLADNASTTISESYRSPASNLTGMVVVDLTNLNQQIDFLLPNTN